MLHALILMEASTATVHKAFREMEHFVMVLFYKFLCIHSNTQDFAADVDECQSSDPVCDINANCSNTYGSYFCTCRSGYTGDGLQCNGNLPSKFAL